MRNILPLAVLLVALGGSGLRAQSAREAQAKFNKLPQPALVADYNYPPSVVEAALRTRLERAGLGSGSSSKGFLTYKGVNWPEVSSDKLDLYARVDGKGEKSTVTLLLSKGYDNFISGVSDAVVMERGKTFLATLASAAAAQSLSLAIAAQEETLRRAEREQYDAVKAGEQLAKEQESLQKRIAENMAAQTSRQTKVMEEKSKLEGMKLQLGSMK